jgi:YaiO family outer membrane protein
MQMILILISVLLSTFQAVASEPIDEAKLAFAIGDYETSIESYRLCLEDDPESYEALFGLARSLAYSGNHDEALKVLTKLLVYYDNDIDGLLLRGRIHSWVGNWRQAEKDLILAGILNPLYTDVWSALGDMYLWHGDYEEAAEMFNQLVAKYPENADNYISRAKAMMGIRFYNSARSDLNRALQLGGNQRDVESLLNRIMRDQAAVWEADVLFNNTIFTSNPERSDWVLLEGSLKHEFNFGSVAFGYTRVRRFDKWDDVLMLDSYINIWRMAYANIQVRPALSVQFLPRLEYLAEIFQGIGSYWEVSAGFILKQYDDDNVNIYILSAARIVGSFYLRERLYISSNSGKTNQTHLLTTRWYPGKIDDFLEANIGFSNIREYSEDTMRDNLLQTMTYEVRLQRFLNPRIGMVITGSYKGEDDGIIGRDLKLKLIYRW